MTRKEQSLNEGRIPVGAIANTYFAPETRRVLKRIDREDLVHEIALLRKLCHQINSELKAITRQDYETHNVLANSLILENFVEGEDVWGMQTSSSDVWLTEEDLEGLPPLAQARMRQAHESRTRPLQLALLLNNPTTLNLINQALSLLNSLTLQLGFNYANIDISSAYAQRAIRWEDRKLLTSLEFLLLLRERGISARDKIIERIFFWEEKLKDLNIEELQNLVSKKLGSTNSHTKLDYIKKHNLWTDEEALRMMCIPRELRDLVAEFYGIIRNAKAHETTGYHTGQIINVMRSALRTMT